MTFTHDKILCAAFLYVSVNCIALYVSQSFLHCDKLKLRKRATIFGDELFGVLCWQFLASAAQNVNFLSTMSFFMHASLVSKNIIHKKGVSNLRSIDKQARIFFHVKEKKKKCFCFTQ